MNISELLTKNVNDRNVVDQLCKSTGAEPDKMQDAIKLGIPTLVEAMTKNAQSTEGAASLNGALEKHKDSNVDDVLGFLKNVDTKDGSKMLSHIFGNDKENVQSNISKQTGLKSNQVGGMLAALAPLLMGMLGKQKSSKNVGSSGLSSMFTGILGSLATAGLTRAVTKNLDSNKDGSIMDELGKIAGGLFNKE